MWHIEEIIEVVEERHMEKSLELVGDAMVTTFTRTVEEWASNLLVKLIVKGDIDDYSFLEFSGRPDLSEFDSSYCTYAVT
jgi:hypothetical protein